MVGSCNALVCLTIPDVRTRNGDGRILLWNPSLKKYRKLPLRLDGLQDGYDESNDDYKVVGILSVCHGTQEGTIKEENVVKMYS